MLTADSQTAQRFMEQRASLKEVTVEEKVDRLSKLGQSVRRRDLQMISRAGLGHIGGDFSVTDILATLYGAVLEVDPQNPQAPERDRFILSKGHCAGALYSTLAACGFFADAELDTFVEPLSPLNGHPNRNKVPGVETNTGPLGHGFPIAVGHALAAKLQSSSRRTFVVMGDGELQEGSNWEAAMTAAHYGLTSLTAIVDRNRFQQGAGTEETKRLDPLGDKWASFGFEVREVNGHDYAELLEALTPKGTDKPVCVIANTIKGKGVSFMENRAEWHHKVPSSDQVQSALEELSR